MKTELNNQFILKNKHVTLKPFEKKNISERFLTYLNNKKINQYLEIGRKKQTKKSALNYEKFYKKMKLIIAKLYKKPLSCI